MVKVFFCPGGINYKNMKPISRFAMKMFAKSLLNKKDATEEEKKQGEIWLIQRTLGKDYPMGRRF